MTRVSIVWLLILCWVAVGTSEAAPPVKKVLVFGVDGCRFDAVEKAHTPTFDRLIARGSLATNTTIIAPRPVTSDTTSGPGWSSLMTGVWSDKHRVTSNAFKERGFDRYPHWFARIKQSQPQRRTVSFDGWGPIHKYVVSAADLTEDVNGGSKDYAAVDRKTLTLALQELKQHDPDALFVYLGDIDETGHKHGFHPTVE
ncbi:MAG: alkaline phosphatase family protein, partial [Planctomycetaceae bacterium]|nr:alkaline phosphatase family protein [Planctomycetaceae bacterium]